MANLVDLVMHQQQAPYRLAGAFDLLSQGISEGRVNRAGRGALGLGEITPDALRQYAASQGLNANEAAMLADKMFKFQTDPNIALKKQQLQQGQEELDWKKKYQQGLLNLEEKKLQKPNKLITHEFERNGKKYLGFYDPYDGTRKAFVEIGELEAKWPPWVLKAINTSLEKWEANNRIINYIPPDRKLDDKNFMAAHEANKQEAYKENKRIEKFLKKYHINLEEPLGGELTYEEKPIYPEEGGMGGSTETGQLGFEGSWTRKPSAESNPYDWRNYLKP